MTSALNLDEFALIDRILERLGESVARDILVPPGDDAAGWAPANPGVLATTDVLTEGNRVTGVVIANKAGLSLVKPRITIDATGDGDVSAWAGAPVEKTSPLQPMTLHFRVGNVHDTEGGTTWCPGCQAPLIERDWHAVTHYGLDARGACPHCGTAIAGRFAERYERGFGRRRIPVRLAMA